MPVTVRLSRDEVFLSVEEQALVFSDCIPELAGANSHRDELFRGQATQSSISVLGVLLRGAISILRPKLVAGVALVCLPRHETL